MTSGPAGARPGGTGGVALGFGIMSRPTSPGGAVGLVGTRLGDIVSALETVGITAGCGLVLSGVLGTASLVAGVVEAGLLPASPSSPGVVVTFSPAPEASIGCGVGVDGVGAGTPGGSSPDSIRAGPARPEVGVPHQAECLCWCLPESQSLIHQMTGASPELPVWPAPC